MENNEELVTNVTENVDELATEELTEGTTEPTTEEVSEPVKTYTDAEVDEIVKKKLYRQEQKFNKQMSAYKKAEAVLNAGLGTSNIEEATNNLADFYKNKGITIPDYQETRSEHEIEILAKDDAKTIIDSGYEDIVEETDRLAQIGFENMTKRDKIMFQELAREREKIESEKAAAELGISKEEIDSEEFRSFTEKLNPNLSIKEKYDMYSKMKPRKVENKMGSMKNGASSLVKDYYSPEEIARLTEEDLNNPQVWKAVRRSMTENYKSY